MPQYLHSRFKKTLLASVIAATTAPQSTWAALDFADAPPGTVEPYVAPNVIISIDDSGSMAYRVAGSGNGSNKIGPGFTEPYANGTWNPDAQRISVLKYAVKEVFSDKILLPDEKIRLAWQSLHNNGNSSGPGKGKSPGANDVNTDGMHNMRVLDKDHRENFINFVSWMNANSGTPTHKMAYQAHKYMTGGLNEKSPWASLPGSKGEPFLGCRRNYHILMSDGGWQTAPTGAQKPGNVDGGDAFTLPDKATVFNKVKPYADKHENMVADWAFKSWATDLQPALKDNVPLSNEYDTAPATENFGKDAKGKDAILTKFWNPRYNPATWRHMVTYSIGFSKAATTWPGEPNIKRPSDTDITPFSYDAGKNGSLPDFITGNIEWPLLTTGTVDTKNPLDLWHAAINGRGRFYAVENGEDLEKAFREIVKTIGTQTEPDRGSTATSGSNASRNDVGRYTATYVPKEGWRGWVAAEIYKTDGTTVAAWNGKSTADLLDAGGFNVGNRLVLSWSDKVTNTATGEVRGGVSFKWANDESLLSTAQKNLIKGTTDNTSSANQLGQNRLNFIRGDRSLEPTDTPPTYTSSKPLRQRKSRQGSIVNSEVWYVGAPVSNYPLKGYAAFTRTHKDRLPMIYVGGNDGMLHGFSAVDGTEKIAYVPHGVIATLPQITNPVFNNNHKYSVDGSPMTGDVDLGLGNPDDATYNPNWRTMLVGTLGAGGKGYFVLDVTTPGSITTGGGNFSEANSNQLVVLDKTRHASETTASVADCANTSITPIDRKEACLAAADLGHIFAKPVKDETNPQRTTQIARMNNNRWAVVMGNGYNSKSERPVLFIQYLDGAKELLRLVATGATDTGADSNTTANGLSAPRLVDINGDGRPDVVYAGDLKGNLWKFLITDSDDTKWGVARWGSSAADTTPHTTQGIPLFTARGGTEGSPNSRTLLQPITAPPSARANDRMKEITVSGKTKKVPVGGMMVAFGTGRNVTKDDPQNNNKQTLYAVLDNTRYKKVGPKEDRVQVCASITDDPCDKLLTSSADLPSTVTQTQLVQRAVPNTAAHTRSGRSFWTVNELETLNWSTHKGWYMDLPETRERTLKPLEFYDSSNLLTVLSQVPAKGSRVEPDVESCEAGSVDDERQYLTLINIMDGKRPSVQLMNTDGVNGYDLVADKGASRMTVPAGAITMIVQNGETVVSGSKKDGTKDEEKLALMPEVSMRPSWRQLR